MQQALPRKVNTELGIKSPAAKFYNLFATKLNCVQNLCERVPETKLQEGDWHVVGSVINWTYVIDGKVNTCDERIEAIDKHNKTIKYSLFGGDISRNFKTFTLILQVTDNIDGSGAAVKWTIEYEKLHEDNEPPHGWVDYLNKCTGDIDANLFKV
ncbi:MLP-like protein 31 [Lotus japonicus]|uniref:MLP-like protein 31 n=1 Tax=Lotus japonicus TaxID=34305 RepID=UPI00258C1045|nr:MLP-like protein 31 [Lotus japonicus]